LSHNVPGQLSLFANQVQGQAGFNRQGGAKDKAPGLDRQQLGGLVGRNKVRQVVYGAGKALGVADQWGDVLEQDAGLREVRYIPDQVFYLVLVYGGLLFGCG
jgi:hypothetical protein